MGSDCNGYRISFKDDESAVDLDSGWWWFYNLVNARKTTELYTVEE